MMAQGTKVVVIHVLEARVQMELTLLLLHYKTPTNFTV